MADASDVTVRDNPPENSYELLLDGDRVGRRLVAGALEDIRARGLSLIPVCPFVTSYLRRHPGYADLVAREPAAPE